LKIKVDLIGGGKTGPKPVSHERRVLLHVYAVQWSAFGAVNYLLFSSGQNFLYISSLL